MKDKFENGELGNDRMQDFFIRNTYMLMLCGTFDSPLGPRREMKPDDFKQFGEWQDCSTPPGSGGFYFLEGDYENSDGRWPDSVLPAWWHEDYIEWECSDGVFNTPRRWMVIPWLPDVWQAAKEHDEESTRRFNARYNKPSEPTP